MEKENNLQNNMENIMENQIAADEVLDCVGLYCPVPIFETRKKINKMQRGQILKLQADDPGSESDMKSWAKTTGNELLRIDKEGNIFTFYIKKTE